MQNRAAAKLFPLLLLLLLSPYVESFTLQPFHPSLAPRTNGYVSFSDRSPRLSTPRSSSSTVRMSENLPKNIKDSLQQLRNAMQAALSSKCSRMDVEFPYGSNIGVEGRKTPTESDIPMVGAGDAQASDRELARAMVEMFRGTEIEENLVVAFTDSSQANKATKKWAGAFAGEVIVLDSKQSKKPARGGGGGFGASAKGAVVKARASAIPPGTEVLIVVGPTVKDLKALEHICSEVGMGCLVILANARLDELRYESDSQRDFFETEFERVYHLRPSPSPSWQGGVLFRSFPGEWTLAMPRKIGPPKVLLKSAEKPSMETIDAALRKEKEASDSSGGFPNPFSFFQ